MWKKKLFFCLFLSLLLTGVNTTFHSELLVQLQLTQFDLVVKYNPLHTFSKGIVKVRNRVMI